MLTFITCFYRVAMSVGLLTGQRMNDEVGQKHQETSVVFIRCALGNLFIHNVYQYNAFSNSTVKNFRITKCSQLLNFLTKHTSESQLLINEAT